MDVVTQLRRPGEALRVDSLYGATSHPYFVWTQPDHRVACAGAPHRLKTPPLPASVQLPFVARPPSIPGSGRLMVICSDRSPPLTPSRIMSPGDAGHPPPPPPPPPPPQQQQQQYLEHQHQHQHQQQHEHHHHNSGHHDIHNHHNRPKQWPPAAAAAAVAGFAAANAPPRTPILAGCDITTATSGAATSAAPTPTAITPAAEANVAVSTAITSKLVAAGAAKTTTTTSSSTSSAGRIGLPNGAVRHSGHASDSTSPPPSAAASTRHLSPHPGAFRPKYKPAAAMPGRPAKRSADGEDDCSTPASTRPKLPRTERGSEDFSTVVKNRLQSYTRTGQACDRCKVRKIRCDALPEGCSHCVNLNLDCFVTDRVTGRTERRGYMQELEREKNGMLAHICDLEKLLRSNGVEVRPWQGATWAQFPPDGPVDDLENHVRDLSSSDADSWTQMGSLWVRNLTAKPPHAVPVLPFNHQWESRPGQSHLGVGPDNAPLSSIRGTKLSLLGTTIDTMSFDAPDMDEPGLNVRSSGPLYNKSVQAFLQSYMGVNPPIHVDLPLRNDAFTYADWYFLTIGMFLPVLHKPSFMRLLTNIYDEPNFEPSLPDLVTVHMVFSTIFFQYGVRNWQETERRNELNDLSNKHYHFALSKIYDLLCCQDLVAVQALAMIALHTRAFPKPGCGSIMASMALHRALELNLHRSSKKPGESTHLQNELRKRVWWVILTVVVVMNGKRGCPLPVNVRDFDTEFPEPIADELLSDHGVDTSQSIPCHYQAGLAGFKIIPLFMEMYSNIYSVRRDVQNYIKVVNALERQLEQWETELPDSLRIDPAGGLENASPQAIYTRTFGLELRLCLRHPSVAMTTDRRMMAENTRICEETAREFLICMKQLNKKKSLDTTWYQISVYGVCIFSMLVAHWERRFETTPEQVSVLRKDMQNWLTIVGDTSLQLGISNQIRQIIEQTINWIEHDMQEKDLGKSSPPAAVVIKQEEQLPQAALHPSSRAGEGVPGEASATQTDGQGKGFYQEPGLDGQASCPSLTYTEPSRGGASAPAPAFQSEPALFYATVPSATVVQSNSAQPNPMATYVSQSTQPVSTQASTDIMWQTGTENTWNQWTATIAGCPERYSADALLALGGAGRGTVNTPPMMADGTVSQTAGDMAMVPPGSQWPLIMFDHTTQG